MMTLHWFHGIGWYTRIRDIGWTYVFLVVAVPIMCRLVYSLWKDFR